LDSLIDEPRVYITSEPILRADDSSGGEKARSFVCFAALLDGESLDSPIEELMVVFTASGMTLKIGGLAKLTLELNALSELALGGVGTSSELILIVDGSSELTSSVGALLELLLGGVGGPSELTELGVDDTSEGDWETMLRGGAESAMIE